MVYQHEKLTFELNPSAGNDRRTLIIRRNQIMDESEIVSKMLLIFYRVNPSLDNLADAQLSGLSYGQSYKTEPKWILAVDSSEDKLQRIGISVPNKLLNKLITEMIDSGHRVIPIVSGISPYNH